jgi:beta-N-acetylhexosaminidase
MSNYINTMTLEEQIGQTLMVGFPGTTPSREVIELIQRYHVGNILLFSRNVLDAEQVRTLTAHLQQAAREAGHAHPLLIAVDQENGIVQRLGEAATLFPGNMSLGAIGSQEIAFDVARATARELKALGINMNLAPVVDVNNNAANPVIGVRSFGEDAQLVARLGSAMVRGYQDVGVISCLKHFPGHGDTAVDSHLALPTIPHTLERLEAVELVPFRSGIEAGTASIMIAHMAFPALTRDNALPATLSSAIIQGLLREKLGFEGVILSDCLEMQAISNTFGTASAATMALQAGIDLSLVSHQADLPI